MEPLHRPFIYAVPALLAAVLASQEPEPGADVTSLFTVADGLKVTLWSRSPQFHNPTAIDVDHRGRLWVTEAVDYR
ncbi:MAG: hypothetical protein QF412_08595, partial [Planctomycetota bacterium]|nr:hypothetical protein [Planctomycetota bacterium]